MNRLLSCSLLILFSWGIHAQNKSFDFNVEPINKKVGEYSLTVDLGTPLNSYLSMQYIITSGKRKLWKAISSYELRYRMPPENTPDQVVPKQKIDCELNYTINEIITYRDSVAAIIAYNNSASDPFYTIYWCVLENKRWVTKGGGSEKTIENAREIVKTNAPTFLAKLHITERLKQQPSDTLTFENYLKNDSQSPKRFILNALSNNKIVIYGTLQRRKASWDLMRRTIRDSRFAEVTGTVFLELPSHAQAQLDLFFENKMMDPQIILNIFRDGKVCGLYDKGLFEFIIELWNQNKTLPDSKKIKVILVDYQPPYSAIKNKTELRNYTDKDRNSEMADAIEKSIKASNDKRNSLFIVGFTYARKSGVPNLFPTLKGEITQLPVGALLAERFTHKQVFSIFQHIAPVSNDGRMYGLLRHGFFDYLFASAGNKSLAFKLRNSPFGAEPFDGIPEIAYNSKTGNYENNFDGYIFLEPLQTEKSDYILYEVFSNKFISEMKRRASYLDINKEEFWQGVKVKDFSAQTIKENLKKEHDGKNRWKNVPKN